MRNRYWRFQVWRRDPKGYAATLARINAQTDYPGKAIR